MTQTTQTIGQPLVDEEPQLLLTVEQAAHRLNLGRTMAYALIARGELESVRVGRLRRVKPAALEAYVRRLTAAPPTATT